MKYILWILGTLHASAFVVERCTPNNRGTFSPFAADADADADVACSSTRPATRHFELSSRLDSSLFSTPPKRVARRDLKKVCDSILCSPQNIEEPTIRSAQPKFSLFLPPFLPFSEK